MDGKQHYLDDLAKEGILPASEDFIEKENNVKSISRPTPKPTKPTAETKPTTRNSLIPPKDFGLTWPGRLQRHHQIWEELQFHLNLQKHPNAISVLLRVLLELSIENYIKESGVKVYENDKLAARLEKVGTHLHSAGKIDNKHIDIIKKFKQGDELVSADTLNKYVHSPNFAPSPEHLASMWDSLADIVVLCLKA